jgi:hypothetical protein
MLKSSERDTGVVVPEDMERATPAVPHLDASANRWSGSGLGESHVAYLDLAAEVERRREAGETFSPVYRIYLRDGTGAVMSGHTVAIESDAEAMRVAAILCHARKDAAARFEIWKGEMMLAFDGSDTKPATRLSQQFQHAALDQRQLADGGRAWAKRHAQ